MSKRKLLDTFKNNDPNLSQLDSLKDLLFINSIPYKETVHTEQPQQTLQDCNGSYIFALTSPQITENTIKIQFTEICYTFKFKSKHLVAIDTDFRTNDDQNKIEDDLANVIQEWTTEMFNKLPRSKRI